MPYPHHKDRHQYLNAATLVEAGAAIIVDDVPDEALPDDDPDLRGFRAGWRCEAIARHDVLLAAIVAGDGRIADLARVGLHATAP